TRSASQRRPTLVWLWFCSLRHVNAHLSFNITITQMPTQTYFPLFTKLPEGRVERWRLVEEFIDTWYRPLRASDGVSEATLRSAERRLGFKLPVAVREWYALAGNRENVRRKENHLLNIAKLGMEEDFNALVIYCEIQGNEYWGVRRRDLDLDDPPIYQFLEPARISPTTTAFAIQALLHEAANSANIVAVNSQGNHADILQEVRRKFVRSDLPAHR